MSGARSSSAARGRGGGGGGGGEGSPARAHAGSWPRSSGRAVSPCTGRQVGRPPPRPRQTTPSLVEPNVGAERSAVPIGLRPSDDSALDYGAVHYSKSQKPRQVLAVAWLRAVGVEAAEVQLTFDWVPATGPRAPRTPPAPQEGSLADRLLPGAAGYCVLVRHTCLHPLQLFVIRRKGSRQVQALLCFCRLVAALNGYSIFPEPNRQKVPRNIVGVACFAGS